RPPPSATLFPYTTLFRSLFVVIVHVQHALVVAQRFTPNHLHLGVSCLSRGYQAHLASGGGQLLRTGARRNTVNELDLIRPEVPRSEEHTSELQSLAYLVC